MYKRSPIHRIRTAPASDALYLQLTEEIDLEKCLDVYSRFAKFLQGERLSVKRLEEEGANPLELLAFQASAWKISNNFRAAIPERHIHVLGKFFPDGSFHMNNS